MVHEKEEYADDEIEENDDVVVVDDDDENEEKRDEDDDDDGVLMMVDVCTDGVVMMVMGKILWQSMLAVTFWENKNPSRALSGIGCVCPDGVSPDGWWCLSSCWCLGGLPIVFLWLLASWWHFGGVSVSLDGVQWCFESCSCFRGVFVVFWRCSGGVLVVLKKRYCFGVTWFPGQYQIGVNGDVKLCYWVVCWVNWFHIN